ncbi:zinc finger-containing ubiquitin peptidase [Anaeramoeba flamelloides]|uniref:Zinc finger-containing ubiquitin peptidase n=1 Tax=Anaeramoeba flamelloides TaxID=1746091 RepID=A0AAV8A050_9EUKA|nr:zinc finger-containing ubiquitin peptidase [Anaeramoeba flamelloides]
MDIDFSLCPLCNKYVPLSLISVHSTLHSSEKEIILIDIDIDEGYQLFHSLVNKYSNDKRNKKHLQQIHFCSKLEFYSQSKQAICGYRNIQMILSNLLQKFDLFESKSPPTVYKIQQLIEAAWKCGFDLEGSKHFQNGGILGTDKWIGATEFATLLNYLGIKNQIYDFDKKYKSNNHVHLFNFVWDHFQSFKKEGNEQNQQKVVQVPPLYLQSKWHSVTIIGIERTGKKITNQNLLVFDPLRNHERLKNSILNGKFNTIKKSFLKISKLMQYQIVVPKYTPHTKFEREKSKTIRSIQIPSQPLLNNHPNSLQRKRNFNKHQQKNKTVETNNNQKRKRKNDHKKKKN